MSTWIDIDAGSLKYPKVKKAFDGYGIYRIRVVDSFKRPIPIPRMAAVDKEGVIYIGRSGYRRQKTGRTVNVRLGEFVGKDQHSGGITYSLAMRTLKHIRRFKSHGLQASARIVSDQMIDALEERELKKYFERFGELPPCNSAMPRKHE